MYDYAGQPKSTFSVEIVSCLQPPISTCMSFQGQLKTKNDKEGKSGVILHSKQKFTYNTHNTTHIKLYIGNIIAKKFIYTYITATCRISEH